MSNNYKKDIQFYYDACHTLAKMFVETYFADKWYPVESIYYFWCGDDIGQTLCINDYFFDTETMADAFKYGVNKKTLFKYYDWMVEVNSREKQENRSLYWYLSLNKLLPKKR